MADNVAITAGSGTTIAADDVSSVYYQRVKVDLGGDGAASPLVRGQQADANSMPVTLSTEQAAFLDGIETKLDTVNTNLGTIDGRVDGLEAQLTTIAGYVDGLEALARAGYAASATFTPAASSHVAGDANGAAAEFALAAPSACVFMITSVSLEIDGGTAEATGWILYLYNVTPPSAYADDAAWDLPSGDRASFLARIPLGTAVDLGSTQWIATHGVNVTVKLSGTSVFGYLVNDTTLTPAAVAHKVTIAGVAL